MLLMVAPLYFEELYLEVFSMWLGSIAPKVKSSYLLISSSSLFLFEILMVRRTASMPLLEDKKNTRFGGV